MIIIFVIAALIFIILFKSRFPEIEDLRRFTKYLSGTNIQTLEIKEYFGLKRIKISINPIKEQIDNNTPLANTEIIQIQSNSEINISPDLPDGNQNIRIVEIKSKFIGIFKLEIGEEGIQPVSVNDEVEPGQTVCIITSMNLPNQVKSETSGAITKILVEDDNPVEYGQALMLIKLK